MKITVIGGGYLGLVSGVCLAVKRHEVICVDRLREKVDGINRGEPPIFEKGLEKLLGQVVGKNFCASTDFRSSVLKTELTLIAVGTPFDGERIDLTDVQKVSEQLGEVLKEKAGYHTVVVNSTVVPGTTEEMVLPLLESRSGKKTGVDFGVGMVPEFLREGEAITDFMYPDRIVLGGIDDATLAKLDELYAVFTDTEKIRTRPRTAEMIKYAANALLATLVSFSNEIGNLCSSVGKVDALEVMRGVHLDKRFSPILESGHRVYPSSIHYLTAGCGFGGSCLPKDLNALIKFGADRDVDMPLLKSVIETNRHQPLEMLKLVRRHYPEFQGLRFAVLGLAFKPGTDDVRESASIRLIEALLREEVSIAVYDPIARENTKRVLGEEGIVYSPSLEECVSDAEVVLLMTSWPEFEKLPQILSKIKPDPLFVDGRRFIPKSTINRYEGIGLS